MSGMSTMTRPAVAEMPTLIGENVAPPNETPAQTAKRMNLLRPESVAAGFAMDAYGWATRN